MKSSYRPVAVLALIAAGLIPAALAGSAAASPAAGAGPAAGRPGAAPPAGTRLWVDRYAGGSTRSGTSDSVAVSPDGSTAYVAGLTYMPHSTTPMATVDTVAYNAATGATLWVARFHGISPHHPNGIPAVAVSLDGSEVFVLGHFPFFAAGQWLMLAYNAKTGAHLWTALGTAVFGTIAAPVIAVSPGSSTVYVTGVTYEVGRRAYRTVAYNARTGAPVWQSSLQLGQFARPKVTSLALSPDGSTLFVSGNEGTVAYNAATGAQVWADRYKQRWQRFGEQVAVSLDSSTVFVTMTSRLPVTQPARYLTVAYNAATGATRWSAFIMTPQAGGLPSLTVSPDGSRVFVAGHGFATNTGPDEYVAVAYNASTGAVVWAQRHPITGTGFLYPASMAVSPDGSQVFVAGAGNGPTSTRPTYVTAAYAASTGARAWAAQYQAAGGVDTAPGLALSPDGSRVFVNGTIGDINTKTYFVTIALQG